MSPRTEEQIRLIREKKKAEIREVALELFAEQGYYGASISKIAKRAAISKGLIYNYTLAFPCNLISMRWLEIRLKT
ncbi:MAG: helix-turn-helix domain-containing protein [Bacteroidales bacterium]